MGVKLVLQIDVEKEKALLEELAKAHNDGDQDLEITDHDLQSLQAQAILDKLHVDNFILEDFNAKRFSSIYEVFRIASLFKFTHASLSSEEPIVFSSLYTIFTEEELIALNSSNKLILQVMNGFSLGYVAPQPHIAVQDNSVRIIEDVYKELKGSYNCKSEQLYLLLANRNTGFIEKVLRPKHDEREKHCSFKEGWIDHIGKVLNDAKSDYVIVGTYHSHPKLRNCLDCATVAPSPEDTNDEHLFPDGEMALIGYADTFNPESAEDQFEMNAYGVEHNSGKTPIHYTLEIIPSNVDDAFLDAELAKYEPFRKKEQPEFNVEYADVQELLNDIEPDFVEAVRGKKLKMNLSPFHDGSYKISIFVDATNIDRLSSFELVYKSDQKIDNSYVQMNINHILYAMVLIKGNGGSLPAIYLKKLLPRIVSLLQRLSTKNE